MAISLYPVDWPFAIFKVLTGEHPNVTLSGIANGAGTAYLCTTLATGIISTSTSACNPSSLRFKENVHDLPYGLDEILKMRPIGYTYIPEMRIPGEQIGFGAEDMIQIIPEVVGKDSEGKPSNIDYAKLVAPLTKAVQQLSTKIDEILKSITQLFEHDKAQDQRIDKLEKEIQRLKLQCAIIQYHF